MGKLIYSKKSLFEAPKGSILFHACNGMGVWGSGIAREFKERFPESFQIYRDHCYYHDHPLMFPALVTPKEKGYRVGCLLTSQNYGGRVDEAYKILENTQRALDLLAERWIDLISRTPLYSNKFNSGLFNVPWKDTEKLLKKFVDKYNLTWIVCDPNLEV